MSITREIGAHYTPGKGTLFTVWAPAAAQVDVVLKDNDNIIPLQREAFGYWTALSEETGPGARYTFQLDEEVERPTLPHIFSLTACTNLSRGGPHFLCVD
ncbi:malto-oligosyltrehalose trehalohydrolase [Pontibacter sp. BAB1700]|uniref:malto-oligosyltrehalose trehalohydrolase n=1 Tax=Pontibacter sp. BAB1700 TaxID=1144253 RepID=UPI00026BD601|nr:malto-oligosyltrehalose trehalohydrolase [Pontibacter sp. BAB1700]EJF10105.1 malto-oligosyltrehalose trehalohydrolase [Pontibacter sp. BAB1700]